MHSCTERERKRPLGKREAGPGEGGGGGAEDRGKEEGDGIRTEQRELQSVMPSHVRRNVFVQRWESQTSLRAVLTASPTLHHCHTTHTRFFPTTCRRMWKLEAAACHLSRIRLQHVSAHAPHARALPSASSQPRDVPDPKPPPALVIS